VADTETLQLTAASAPIAVETVTAEAITSRGEAARVRTANRAINLAEQQLRERQTWLRHQDALGLGLWLGALVTWAGLVALFLLGHLSPWLLVPLAALPLSILHELEHDLIHDLYFKAQPRLQNALFTGIWLAKGSLNPWARGDIHLRHHRLSGQPGDVEERLIGLGVRSVPLRLLIAALPASAVVLIPSIRRDAPDWQVIRGSMWSGARQIQRLDLLFFGLPILLPILWYLGVPYARELYLCWIAPNALRHFCIVLMSAYSHYYEIPRHDVTQQNQILRHPLLWPLQVFCMDFGATHIIHHYVVTQPFYVRHLIRKQGWAAVEAAGARVNDVAIVRRANRWSDGVPVLAESTEAMP
jgi:fatty acid desaturase